MEAHETHEMVHHAAHGGGHGDHGHAEDAAKRNRRIAILISLIACLLAIIEIGGNSSQHNALAAHIEASNLWAFYQAKTIRMTQTKSSAEMLEAMLPRGVPSDQAAAWTKRIDDFRAAAKRYDSEPETREGRKELMQRAKESEAKHDKALHAYHLYEYAAACMQIGIVLASAGAATGVVVLAYLAGGLAGVGVAIASMAWLAAH
ncbi:hypothetical protein SIID45300_01975 [Candidatus Magnetaquicoccaceae bacterium FCR-1]|uniref:DUF4337 domain-containing protein n=1 Tax=Candidatus Magnetaquiglobus chichijimensis TaxID=3141448 RepID=A0ABQ0C9U8_9PROT